MVELTQQPIDVAALLGRMGSNQAGAVVLFLGTTREFTSGRQTASLEYECYPEMARSELAGSRPKPATAGHWSPARSCIGWGRSPWARRAWPWP